MSPARQSLETGGSTEGCAQRILETVPLVMRVIRREMRDAAGSALSVPQFRVLAYLGRHRGASLAQLAGHMGVADATASAMVERLVRRGLLTREPHPEERRRVVLGLTDEGSALLEQARNRARAFLARSLVSLEEAQRLQLAAGLEALAAALDPAHGGTRP